MLPGSDPNEMVIGLGDALSLGLTSPHLLAARAHRGACTVYRDEAEPADEPVAAPLSTELWHCTAYPEIPEATWAQPLSREELS